MKHFLHSQFPLAINRTYNRWTMSANTFLGCLISLPTYSTLHYTLLRHMLTSLNSIYTMNVVIECSNCMRRCCESEEFDYDTRWECIEQGMRLGSFHINVIKRAWLTRAINVSSFRNTSALGGAAFVAPNQVTLYWLRIHNFSQFVPLM
jgi:hypothetical protein